MKRLFALLALVGAVAFGAPAWAEEKVAAPEAAAAQVAATAAPAAAAAEAAPAAAPRRWWPTRATTPG
jgi:Amt family ammonium transporter